MAHAFYSRAVERINIGEYVRKIGPTGDMQAKTYIRADYDRTSKSYGLRDTDDNSRMVYVKKGTKLAIGFTY